MSRKWRSSTKAGVLAGAICRTSGAWSSKETRSLDSLRKTLPGSGYDGILVIPEIKNLYANSYTVFYYSEKNPSLDIESQIKSKVAARIREYKIVSLNLREKQLEALESKVELDPDLIDQKMLRLRARSPGWWALSWAFPWASSCICRFLSAA
ncbi:MAG: hypothetical protein IPJ00_08205 [Saprospirales bacterium]|nr:hypothetical protein [Saprospirales bacterium]